MNPQHANTYINRGFAYETKGEFDAAIRDYTKAIELNPQHAEVYTARGVVYWQKGNVDAAIQDYTKAIELNPQYAKVYTARGVAWLHLREWEKAKADLSIAKNMGVDIVTLFRRNYESIEGFEQRIGIQLPADLVVLLTPQ